MRSWDNIHQTVSITLLTSICRFLIASGIVLILIGSAVLALGFLGIVNLEIFAFGVTAGVRAVGTVAVLGCLLGAIGSFVQETNKQ